MAPKVDFEFIILRLSLTKNLNPGKRFMSLVRRSPTIAGSTVVGDWIKSICREEIFQLNAGQTFSYCEWRIMSGNAQIFTVDNVRYDKIFLFLGQEQLHWAFYHNVKGLGYINGTVPLHFSYCACCLHKQYNKIISEIQENIENN